MSAISVLSSLGLLSGKGYGHPTDLPGMLQVVEVPVAADAGLKHPQQQKQFAAPSNLDIHQRLAEVSSEK